jgi:hypothetical protein
MYNKSEQESFVMPKSSSRAKPGQIVGVRLPRELLAKLKADAKVLDVVRRDSGEVDAGRVTADPRGAGAGFPGSKEGRLK